MCSFQLNLQHSRLAMVSDKDNWMFCTLRMTTHLFTPSLIPPTSSQRGDGSRIGSLAIVVIFCSVFIDFSQEIFNRCTWLERDYCEPFEALMMVVVQNNNCSFVGDRFFIVSHAQLWEEILKWCNSEVSVVVRYLFHMKLIDKSY